MLKFSDASLPNFWACSQSRKVDTKKQICRDPQNGFWCDNLFPNDLRPCGAQNNFYSAAGTGMGLVSEAIMVELGWMELIISNHNFKKKSYSISLTFL